MNKGFFRWWPRKRQPGRDAVEQAAKLVMRHIGLSGHCACLSTRDAISSPGYLVVLQTIERVPAGIRQDLAWYFARKLHEMLGLDPARVAVTVSDARDATRQRTDPPASSALMQSLVQQANVAAARPTDEGMERVREELIKGRERRRVLRELRAQGVASTGPSPLMVPATDWADLPPASVPDSTQLPLR